MQRVYVLVLVLMTITTLSARAADFLDAAAAINARCLSCHDSETREAGIDLTPLTKPANSSYGEYTGLWTKVNRMVRREEMPPTDAEQLSVSERTAITDWFRTSFVLRNGKAHIGPTPLRRLTRYELENTLEQVLAIRLRPAYRDTITGQIDQSRIRSIVPSDIPGDSGFDNDALRMESLRPPLREITDAVHDALNVFRNTPQALTAVLGQPELPSATEEERIRPLISRLLLRACRGTPAQTKHLTDTWYARYQRHVKDSKDSAESLLHIFEMILVSPDFLYRLEESRDSDQPYPVTGVELATRLSYFLWSAPPDEELLQHGRDGSLLNDEVLQAQTARMLNSPQRLSLAENFAGQWLGFEQLLSNSEYFRDERWNRETYDEALFFFDELIRSDRSILELVDSDWIYRRASALRGDRHRYTLIDRGSFPDVFDDVLSDRQSTSTNKRIRYDPPVLVETRNNREGGLITSAAIMRLTASKSRTSPIRRGVWILDTVIGRKLEPPPDIPSLEEARESLTFKENPTVAEVIQQHVSKPECVSCHKAIDPLGLGLENFGPLGRWRTKYDDKAPVVSSGVMPNGKPFTTPREMKQLLLEIYGDEISESFVRRLFAYALGRSLQPYDRVTLDAINQHVKQNGHRVNTAIVQIVLSQQFRCRQDR